MRNKINAIGISVLLVVVCLTGCTTTKQEGFAPVEYEQ